VSATAFQEFKHNNNRHGFQQSNLPWPTAFSCWLSIICGNQTFYDTHYSSKRFV